jgi:hypothetical protein
MTPDPELDEYPDLKKKYEDWEDENPPRTSKSKRPKHGVSGRSIFTIWNKIRANMNSKKQ